MSKNQQAQQLMQTKRYKLLQATFNSLGYGIRLEEGTNIGLWRDNEICDYYDLPKKLVKALAQYENSKPDKCECGGTFLLRMNTKNNQQFKGCSKYPKCKNTKNL
jgi:hypothetical protein